MKAIVYPQPNGQLAIVSPTGEVSVDQVAKAAVPAGTPYVFVDGVPDVGPFFDAYEFDQVSGFKINIEKAKKIQRNMFRERRAPLLAKLDVEFMRALETGNTQKQQEVTAKKQALRDITDAPLPDNFENIRTTWPDILRVE